MRKRESSQHIPGSRLNATFPFSPVLFSVPVKVSLLPLPCVPGELPLNQVSAQCDPPREAFPGFLRQSSWLLPLSPAKLETPSQQESLPLNTFGSSEPGIIQKINVR